MLKISKCVGTALCLTFASQFTHVWAKATDNANTMAVNQPVYSLQDAVSLTLKQHPELASFAYRKNISQGLIQQAQVGTPLNIEAKVTDIVGTGEYAGLSAVQTEVGIGWLLEGSQINAKTTVAKTQAQLNSIEVQIKALDLAATSASAYVTLLSQQQQLKLAKLRQFQAQGMLSDINLRVKAGQLASIDALRAKADLAQKALVVEDLIHEIEASKALLAAQWQGNSEFQVSGSLDNLPQMQSIERWQLQLENNPKLQKFTTKQRIAQSQVKLAKVENTPAWKVTTGIKHNQALNDVALSAGIVIPFSNGNRNQGKIKALQAQQLEYQAKSNAWQSNIRTQLLLLTHQLKHNSHVVEGLREEIIPALVQASEQAELAYKQGNYPYSDWYAIQQELNIAQTELIDAYRNIHLFNIELQRLTGTSAATGTSL